MDQITIRKGDDFHLHLRQGAEMGDYARETKRAFSRAIIMPNTLPPVTDPAGLYAYKKVIENEAPGLEALMAYKLLPDMKADIVPEMKKAGAIIAKLYPAGATTNAEDGIRSYEQIKDVLAALEEENVVLSIHGENPEAPVLEREISYLKELEKIIRDFPRLRIVLEHISNKESLDFISGMPGHIAATVTIQHLMISLEDLMGGGLQPHFFCKPVVKSEKDRDALVQAVCSGHPKLFFGSDSAPHLKERKECSVASAGVFSAPAALPLLAGIFEKEEALDKMEGFISEIGARYYGLPLNQETVTLVKEPWTVPQKIGGAVPFFAGKELNWKLV